MYIVLADAKVQLVKRWHVIEKVPIEGHARVGGDREHCDKVIGVKPAQEMWVCHKAGVMRIVLQVCPRGWGDR